MPVSWRGSGIDGSEHRQDEGFSNVQLFRLDFGRASAAPISVTLSKISALQKADMISVNAGFFQVRSNPMQTLPELIELFRQGNQHLTKMALGLDFPWTPTLEEPRRLHNVYARNLVTSYASKFSQLSEAVLDSIENKRFLIYALASRSLIETTATLRYYVVHQYKPLLDKPSLSFDEMEQLIAIDDRHLRGGRFDWESFFFLRYQQLKDDAVKQLESKKAKQKHIAQGIIAEQVNMLTCIEKWAEETPEILIAYNLFCDLVHPNMGSAFLVASANEQGLYFSPAKGKSIGAQIFEQSFPIMVSTLKPFPEYLLMLMGTIWRDDEL